MKKVTDNINIENARILFRNFSGKQGQYNAKGNRNFSVLIPKDLAELLEAQGWNVRWLQPRDEGDEPQAHMSVTVRFEPKPPKIVIVSSRGKTIVDEDNVNILDWAEIESVDITIQPYNWEVNGKTGVKAYVKTMYVTIVEDEFEKKYNDVPDSAVGAIGGCGNCEECDGSCSCKDHAN